MPGKMIQRGPSRQDQRVSSPTHGASSPDLHNRTTQTPKVHGRAVLRAVPENTQAATPAYPTVNEPQGFTVEFDPSGVETVSTASLQQAKQASAPVSGTNWLAIAVLAAVGYYVFNEMK